MSLEIADVRQLPLKPGDVLVITLNRQATVDELAALSARLHAEFPDYRHIIHTPDETVGIASPEEIDRYQREISR